MTNSRRDEKAAAATEAGYRGALPPQNDNLARPWVVIVIVAFVLIFALAFAGIPGSLFPSPTPIPTATPGPTTTASPSGSGSASAEPSASGTASGSAVPSPSVSPSPTP